MTKAHFEYIADLLARSRKAVTRTGDSHVLAQFDTMFIPMVANELAETNPAFNKDRFIAACGVPKLEN